MTVNFTNILWAAFSHQSSLHSFYVLTIGFVIFWQKDFGAKAAHKMLVKLTPSVINRIMYLTAWSSITHKVCHYLKNTVLIFISDTAHSSNVWEHCLHEFPAIFTNRGFEFGKETILSVVLAPRHWEGLTLCRMTYCRIRWHLFNFL
jgi:hypothetical protein